MRQLIKNGIVVYEDGMKKADVLIEGEKIAKVGENISCEDAKIVDATGKYIFPGFIDGHTHLALEVANTITADDFYTGTKAALAGGTTCIVDFATQYPGESLKKALENWHKKADKNSSCDYAFHLAITDWNEEISKELEQVVKEGVTSFKLYMTYDTKVDDATMYEILSRLKELGGIAGVHCENDGIIKARVKKEKEKGNLGPEVHPVCRPKEAEMEAIYRLLKIAKLVDTPIIIVHLSTAEGYEIIRDARKQGQKVYIESCPQYFLLDESYYHLNPEESRKYICSPPLRNKSNQDIFWRALKHGEIQTIATDHCSFTTEQKAMGRDDFTKIPNGMPGLETRPMLMYTYGVGEERISLEKLCETLATNPAKLYGLYPKKGIIAPESDADIVIWNPEKWGILESKKMNTNTDYCPYEGWKVSGEPEQVFLRGKLVAQGGEILEEKTGKYCPRGLNSL
ncbi:MAG: dihydropyrimidinase [Lachnospiraceae bacterium]